MTARRFALVDHGLTGPLGHNLTYARRVLAAARAQDFMVVAGVGRNLEGEDVGAPAHALFPRDVWANNPAEGRLWHAKALVRRALQQSGRPEPPRLPALETDAPPHPAAPRLARVKHGLQADAAVLFALRSNARGFAAELVRFIDAAGLTAGDTIYLPTILATELKSLDLLLERSSAARALRWRAMLRYAPQSKLVRSTLASAAARLHRRPDADVRFYSDTEQLCAAYGALCGTPFELLPVPVDLDVSARHPRPGPLTVGYFGDARDEKGFDLLPEIVRFARAAGDAQKVRFVLQANLNTPEGDALSRRALEELAGMAGPDLELVHGPLTLADYRALFERTDIVLLPYRPDAYAARSSGVLMEAIAAGLPSLVTRGGWMEATLARAPAHPAGRVVEPEASALYAALQLLARDWARYAEGASSLRHALRPRLDPAELVRRITS
jgi:glycosyltransferase involved in cell wall biosynthesis